MTKPALALIAASALTLPAAAFAAPQISIAPAGPVVELNVYETVESAPDVVTISAGVSSEAPKATEAMRQNAAEMTKVIAQIKALGIAEKDIQTTGVNLGPLYDYRDTGQVFRAYQAVNRVSVVLRKVEDAGRILDALVEAGANDISGPFFSIANDTAAKEEARKRAVARGAAQAQAYAKMLGYEGIKVLAVSEAVEASFPVFEMAKVAADVAATSTPIQPGAVSTGVNVTITYELVGASAAGTK